MNFLKILFATLFLFSCSENSNNVAPIEEPIPEQTKYEILFWGTFDDIHGLYKVSSDGSNLHRISDFEDCFLPKWSPDGLKIFYNYGRSEPYQIFVMDSSGNNKTKIADGRDFCISSDGSRLCYVLKSDQPVTWEIYCVNIDGTNNTKLTDSKFQKFGLHWSPTQPEVVFTENDNWNGTFENINIINVDTYEIVTPATGYDLPQVSDWSKDGKYLLFGANHADVFKVDLINKNVMPLTTGGVREEWAKFSFDGSKILFQSNKEGKTNIYIMDSNGSNQQKVSNFSTSSFYPQWSPDGTSISYITASETTNWKIVLANSVGQNEHFLISVENSNQFQFDWFPTKLND